MFVTIVSILAFLVLLWCFLVRGRGNHPQWEKMKVYRYAHRGFHDKPTIPENSMVAFHRAIEHGWGAELDIHLMKDGNLAVIHDSSLKRTTGADVVIEDLTKEDLDQYCLEESKERIPLFEDVLALFEGKTPLIIELKEYKGNASALSEAAYERLKNYKGLYCIESFNTFCVMWFKKHAPKVMRGQLASNFFHSKEVNLSPIKKFMMTFLLSNFLTVPDFVAYEWKERNIASLHLTKVLWKTKEASWTIRNKESLLEAEKENSLPIFERFNPDSMPH